MAANQTTIDPAQFRGALGAFATGVTIITTHSGGIDCGVTASSFNSVSLDPPMVLWSLSKEAASRPAFEKAGYFAVHVLTESQIELSGRFARKGADKFAGLEVERGEGELPLLAGCSARFECRKALEYEGGDHIIFVGEVIKLEHCPSPPLVFHGGRYARAISRDDSSLQDGAQAEGLAYWIAAAYFAWRAPALSLAAQLGLGASDRRMLAALLECEQCSTDAINQSGTHMDPLVSAQTAGRLLELGFVRKADIDEFALTKTGRNAMVEQIASRKAVEAAAILELGPQNAAALSKLLEQFVAATNAGSDGSLRCQLQRLKQLEGVLAKPG